MSSRDGPTCGLIPPLISDDMTLLATCFRLVSRETESRACFRNEWEISWHVLIGRRPLDGVVRALMFRAFISMYCRDAMCDRFSGGMLGKRAIIAAITAVSSFPDTAE